MMEIAAPFGLDLAQLARWIDPLGTDGLADLFFEWKSEVSFTVRDGAIESPCAHAEQGVSARAKIGDRIVLAACAQADEAGTREVVRRLAGLLPSSRYPKADTAVSAERLPVIPDVEKWSRKAASLLSRVCKDQPHHLHFLRRSINRLIVPAARAPRQHERHLLSIDGSVQVNTRGGPQWRSLSFHLPEADREPFDELRLRLQRLASPGARPLEISAGTADVIFDRGSAAFFFHEALAHPLEADAPGQILPALSRARVAPRELQVSDEPGRLDLFGGYPADDEGVPSRRTPLVDAGHLCGLLRDRVHSDSLHPSTGNGRRSGAFDHAAPRSSNLVVAPGGASEAEMLARLGEGLLVDEFDGGTVDTASGKFRLRFPRGQWVHRGRLSHAVAAGFLEGEILPALSSIDPLLGARAWPCRELAWCAREGKIVPVGGEAPALIVRRLQVRPR